MEKGGVSKSMLKLNEAIIDIKEGSVHDKNSEPYPVCLRLFI